MFSSAAAIAIRNEAGGMRSTRGVNVAAMNDFGGPGGGTLINDGSISTTGAPANGMFPDGAVIGNGGRSVIVNGGDIDVTGSDAHGIVSLDASPDTVTNAGSIVARRAGGPGAFVNAASGVVASQQASGIIANGGGTLDNAGTIQGATGVTIGNGGASIVNSGTIRGFRA